jgi:hypothetical protein
VAVTQLLTNVSFLDIACSPFIEEAVRYRYVTKEFATVMGASEAHELWRGIGRVWSVACALTNRLRDAEFLNDQPDDTEFKLLRYSSFLPARSNSSGRQIFGSGC